MTVCREDRAKLSLIITSAGREGYKLEADLCGFLGSLISVKPAWR